MRTFIIGISGGSASGKTTLANKLAEALGRDNVNAVFMPSRFSSHESEADAIQL